jgi:hypothetical protein
VVGERSTYTRQPAIVRVARRLAREVADAADADQWAIALVGVPELGAPNLDELVPRQLLETLNGNRPARYRIMLVLQAEGCDLGIIQLGTLRPSGFSDLDIARARRSAAQASVRFAEAMSDEIPNVIA